MSHGPFASIAFLAACLVATPAVADPAAPQGHYLRHPTGRGDVLVFQYHDRIWRYDKGAAAASPLASTNADAASPAISPDGKAVAFVASKGPDNEVFLVSLESGNLRQLTYDGGSVVKVQGWLSATEVLYTTTIKSKKRGPLLFAVNTATLAGRPIPLAEASEGCVLGSDFIFVKNEELVDSNRAYRGGYAQRIYKVAMSALSAESPVQQKGVKTILLSRNYDGVSRNPVCIGERIYFISDRTGRYSVWSMNAAGGDLVQHTFDKDLDIKSIAALSKTQLLYQKLGEIFVLNLDRKTSEKVVITIPPDLVKKYEQRTFDVTEFSDYQISNDGNTLVAIARGKMWAVEVASRSGRCVVCDSRVRVKSPQILSDAKRVIALADTSGEYDIYEYSLGASSPPKSIPNDIREPIYDISLSPGDAGLLVRTIPGSLYHVDIGSGKTQKIKLESRTKPQEIGWSHNGRYAAFVTYSPEDIGRIAVFDTRCSSTRYLTSGQNDVTSPVFASDDSEIYYITQGNFRSSIIDTWAPSNYWPAYDNRSLVYAVRFGAGSKGVADCTEPSPPSDMSRQSRLLSRELPVVAGNYDRLLLHGGRLLASSKRAARDDWGRLVAVPDRSNGSRGVPELAFRDTVFGYQPSQDGRALVARGNGRLLVSRVDSKGRYGEPIALGAVLGLETRIDLAQEHEQTFREVWRLYRDYFWDAKMAGVDWKAMRDKYVGYLQGVSTRAELNELVSHMVAELGTGHTTLGNPDPAERDQDRRGVGKLGAAFAEDDGLRVVEIYDGDLDVMEERSPLSMAEPPVEVGDRIARVNGFPVVRRASLDHLLEGKVGQTLVVTIKKPDGRLFDVRILPISAEHEAWLRSQHWTWSNRQYVDKRSNSRVGYIRLSAAYEADFASLIRQYAYFHGRTALILDLRGNNGGNVDPWVLQLFQRRTWLYVGDRHDTMALKHPRESFQGQWVVLIDGDTYSDGELIAEGVRRLGLGVLVGTRTAGAGVWVNDDNALIDGGRVRIPVSGSYNATNGKPQMVIEGRGVRPDVLVENDPYEFYFGVDAQLQSAVDVALKPMKKRARRPR